VPTAAAPRPGELVLGLRPEHLSLAPPGSGLAGVVDRVEHLGDEQIAYLTLASGEPLLVRLPAEQARPGVGEAVGVHVPPSRIHFFGADAAGHRIH
jgi:ABC-type sugar transport system ATPase subunit